MTSGERSLFEQQLAEEKRDKLLRLFQVITREENKAFDDISALYKLYYNKAYEKEKDYLLRNELRHLSNALTAFLAQQEQLELLKHDKFNQQILYLKWLLKRGQTELFQIEIRRLQRQLEKTPDPQKEHKLLELEEQFFQFHQPFNSDTFEALAAVIQKHEHCNKRLEAEHTAEVAVLKAYTQRSLLALKPSTTIHEDDLPPLPDQFNPDNAYSYYMILKAQTYHNHGQQKIDGLNKMLQYLPELEHRLDTPADEAIVRASIALEYFLLNEDEAALQEYAQTLPLLKYLEKSKQIQVLYNYINALLRVGDYEQAIGLMDQYKKAIDESNVADRFYCVKAMCHLFNNKVEAAFDSLPKSFLKYSRTDHFYLRAILSIIYYERGDITLAVTEVRNAKKVIRQQQEDYHVMRDMLGFFNKYYSSYESDRLLPSWKAKLLEIQHELKDFIENDNVLLGTNSLPIKWLNQTIKQQLKKVKA